MNIPIEKWAKDHWSTFAYAGCVVTGKNGIPEKDKMRCCIKRHPGMRGPHQQRIPRCGPYPTKIREGDKIVPDLQTEVEDWHDDYDCIEDMVAAGLLIISGTGINPVWALTDAGWAIFKSLSDFKNKGGNFIDFSVQVEDA